MYKHHLLSIDTLLGKARDVLKCVVQEGDSAVTGFRHCVPHTIRGRVRVLSIQDVLQNIN